MLVLLFLYFGFMALAAASDKRASISTLAAIFGVIGAINLPIIHYSVTWWNSLHQPQSLTLSGSAIDSSMLYPLALATLGFTLLFASIIVMRMRTIIAEIRIEARFRRLIQGS